MDLSVPNFSPEEWLVIFGIILIHLTIIVPVVHKVHDSARKATEEMQRRSTPMTLEDVG